MTARERRAITSIVSERPITRSAPRAVHLGHAAANVVDVVASIGYTRQAATKALRNAGIPMRRGRRPSP